MKSHKYYRASIDRELDGARRVKVSTAFMSFGDAQRHGWHATEEAACDSLLARLKNEAEPKRRELQRLDADMALVRAKRGESQRREARAS